MARGSTLSEDGLRGENYNYEEEWAFYLALINGGTIVREKKSSPRRM